MSKDEKEAAIKAALAKRGNIQKVQTNADRSNLANQVKQEKEKRGAKKPKVHGIST